MFSQESAEQTIDILQKEGVPTEIAEESVESGFFIYPEDRIYDSIYGGQLPTGKIPLEYFATYLKEGSCKLSEVPFNPRRKKIKSLKEGLDFLKTWCPGWFENGKVCFRGQTREYFIDRKIKNPRMLEYNTNEPLIIPAFWRQFLSNPNKRFYNECPDLLRKHSILDDLIFDGIPDYKNLYERNLQLYGHHSTSELQDFPDSESQEYYKRMVKKEDLNHDWPIIEQHYGMETNGLDITYDLGTAIYFAINRFKMQNNGKATYQMNLNEKNLVYALVFYGFSTESKINKFDCFKTKIPIRPIRQECALPFFHSYEISSAVTDCILIFEIDEDFNLDELPKYEHLFPPPDEDLFYDYLLKKKIEFPDLLDKIVDYQY